MLKIAVPTRNGHVDEHFGHCEAFQIYSVENSAITAEETYAPPPACGCKSNLVGSLKEMGVDTVIAGNMGNGAAANLQRSGIDAIRGATGDPKEAVLAFLQGTLRNRQDLFCGQGHGGGGHGHGHGHGCNCG